jgi:hypothetical protein
MLRDFWWQFRHWHQPQAVKALPSAAHADPDPVHGKPGGGIFVGMLVHVIQQTSVHVAAAVF